MDDTRDDKKKVWIDPKADLTEIKDVKGGTVSTNAPGDDAWYVS